MICCGCHHLGKGLFRGAGEVGGYAVNFPVGRLPPAKQHCADPQDTLLSPLGRHGCLGWGHAGSLSPLWSRREPGTQLECRVSVVMIGLPSALGLHRSGFAPHLVMGELPRGVPEAAGGSSSAVGGHCQVGTAATAQCSQLQGRDSSSLFCSPPLPRTFPNYTLCLHLAFLSVLGAGLACGGFSYCTWQGGDSQARVSDSWARAVLWPHALVTEHVKNRLLSFTWLAETCTAAFPAPLPAAREELPVVSMWKWVCAGVSG